MISLAPRLAAAAIALAGAAASGFYAGHRWVTSDWNAERLERADLAAEAERMARAADQRRAAGAQEALDAYARNVRRSSADAAAARGELDRLRDALAAAGAASTPEAAARADAAARAGHVVGACARALSEVADAADACESRLTALQEWVRAQTLPE